MIATWKISVGQPGHSGYTIHHTLSLLPESVFGNMSRLASLSTPTRRLSPSPSPSPSIPGSPAQALVTETTHHRMLKLLIAELKSLFRTWDELVGMDAFKSAQAIMNEQTTME